MPKSLPLLVIAVLLLISPRLKAQDSSGTLNVTASVDGSINLTFVSDGSGVSLTGSGSATATVPFSTVSAYGSAPAAGITRTVTGETSFSVATPFDVRVVKANTTSANYTLKATLSSADATNVWLINAVDVSDGSEKQITATGAYSTNASHTLKVTVPFSNTTGSVSNSLSFTATAN